MKNIDVLIGTGWGDEGKGAAVNHLSHRDAVVVRFSGGSQAAHNVIHNNHHHTFHMFGSGTLKGANTFLSRFVRACPFTITQEAEALESVMPDIWNKIKIDGDCLVIMPHHVAVSRYQASIHNRGTCGMGVGKSNEYAMKYPTKAIRMRDLKKNRTILIRKIKAMQVWVKQVTGDLSSHNLSDPSDYADFLIEFAQKIEIVNGKKYLRYLIGDKNAHLIFEGSQGILLDPVYGHIPPYVTSTDVTLNPIFQLLSALDNNMTVYGCIRMYHTRHGVGPFPTEETQMVLPELHNVTNEYQEAFRIGHLDLGLLQYSLDVLDGNVDGLVVSHLDYWDLIPEWKIKTVEGELVVVNDINEYLDMINDICPINLIGSNPSTREKY